MSPMLRPAELPPRGVQPARRADRPQGAVPMVSIAVRAWSRSASDIGAEPAPSVAAAWPSSLVTYVMKSAARTAVSWSSYARQPRGYVTDASGYWPGSAVVRSSSRAKSYGPGPGSGSDTSTTAAGASGDGATN